MFSRLYRRFGVLAAGFKFVFPRAPQRTIVSHTGNETTVHAWYTPCARREDGTVDPNGLNVSQLDTQKKRVHGILDREAHYLGGDCSKLVLGGAQQGGAVALHVSMAFRAPIGALLCLRSVPLPPQITTVPKTGGVTRREATRVFVFAAELDSVHPVRSTIYNTKQARRPAYCRLCA